MTHARKHPALIAGALAGAIIATLVIASNPVQAQPQHKAAAAAAASGTKSVKCSKGFDKVTITAIKPTQVPGFIGFSVVGKNMHADTVETATQFKAKGLGVGSDYCMKRELGDS